MLIYNETKKTFLNHLLTANIEDIIQDKYEMGYNRKVGKNEYISWQNSLPRMGDVLTISQIPDDASVAIEYTISWSSKRIDFIVAWQDEDKQDAIIIVELKQWSDIEMTDKDGVVITRFEHWPKETSHPSYQAWSYAMYMRGFNETVYNENIQLYPCAFLHNYKADGKIDNDFYAPHIQNSPLFLKNDKVKLAEFLSKYVKYGDSSKIMYRIDNGKIRPSKALADSLASMLKWNQEFIMIDDQKVVYETALNLAKKSSELNKHVLIVEGWPWTGKSVVAINLLVAITKQGMTAQYVTKNSAPRAVYESKLTWTLRKTEFSNMFKWSGSYVNAEHNEFDILIVDEAHRLNEKSWMFSNLWENQVKEIIHASKFSVFFIDEDQKVTMKDIWEKEEIEKWARSEGAKVHNLELLSQFRCNGSDWYLAWLDYVLQIHETANIELDKDSYDFQVFDDPSKLRDAILEKNKINNKARLVAGYCWDWVSKGNKDAYDIAFPQYDFAMKWNLATDGMLWIISPESVNEIGCIHTCQWLEVDYVGVIIGDDIIVRNGEVLVDPAKRARTDASLKGYKSLMKTKPEETKTFVKQIIKNTYRTLMTRWMKGCYIYCTDKETGEYFKNLLAT